MHQIECYLPFYEGEIVFLLSIFVRSVIRDTTLMSLVFIPIFLEPKRQKFVTKNSKIHLDAKKRSAILSRYFKSI